MPAKNLRTTKGLRSWRSDRPTPNIINLCGPSTRIFKKSRNWFFTLRTRTGLLRKLKLEEPALRRGSLPGRRHDGRSQSPAAKFADAVAYPDQDADEASERDARSLGDGRNED